MALEFALNRPSGEDNSYGDSPGKGDFGRSHGLLSLKIPCNQEGPSAHTGWQSHGITGLSQLVTQVTPLD